jgi:hypothetical protein
MAPICCTASSNPSVPRVAHRVLTRRVGVVHASEGIQCAGQRTGTRAKLRSKGGGQDVVGDLAAALVLRGEYVDVSRGRTARPLDRRKEALLFELALVIVRAERTKELCRPVQGVGRNGIGIRPETSRHFPIHDDDATNHAMLAHQVFDCRTSSSLSAFSLSLPVASGLDAIRLSLACGPRPLSVSAVLERHALRSHWAPAAVDAATKNRRSMTIAAFLGSLQGNRKRP